MQSRCSLFIVIVVVDKVISLATARRRRRSQSGLSSPRQRRFIRLKRPPIIRITISSHFSDESDHDDSADELTMISLYELADDGQSVIMKSSKLPIFDADVDGSSAKVIMDTDATSVYVSQHFVDKSVPKLRRSPLVRSELRIRISSRSPASVLFA